MRALFITLLCILSMTAVALAKQPNVLVIQSYQSDNPWDSSYLAGLHSALDGQANLSTFEMDTKRLPAAEHPAQAEKAWQAYLRTQPDLVVLGDDNALKYLGPKLLDGKVPVVYLGINNNPEDYIPSGHNITGILERPLFEFCLHTVSQVVQPTPKKVLILFDGGTTSQAAVAEAFRGKTTQLIGNLLVELKLISSWDKWQQTVTQAKQQGFDALVVGLYHTLVDARGKNVPAAEVLRWTSANTPLPPFGFWDFSVGADKTVGGFVLSGQEQAKAAAAIIQQIFAGTPPQQIQPKIGENGKFVFSRRQLDKWNIKLPAHIAGKTQWTE